ncbi:MAG TPA: crosslink repair DNA glycosylase YcaQ family protein, partial [Actinomycetota bacterium]|nr:crosslink repair DNA glycosylase YcaQ family protein [Actinomycetota bacterium]
VPAARPLEREEALAELTRRYLRSHGPATVKDLSWWSGLTMGDLRGALGDLGDEAPHDEVDGLTVWSIPGPPSRAAARAHLLQTYDELVVGYTESRFLGDPNAARARAAWGDRSFPSGVVLDGDLVAGHWKRTTARDGLRIEVVTYARPGEAFREALAAAAERHGAFFGREVTLEVRPVA